MSLYSCIVPPPLPRWPSAGRPPCTCLLLRRVIPVKREFLLGLKGDVVAYRRHTLIFSTMK